MAESQIKENCVESLNIKSRNRKHDTEICITIIEGL